MSLDLIFMEQWALSVLKVPAKLRRKRLREALNEEVKEATKRAETFRAIMDGKLKVRWNHPEAQTR